MRASKVRVSVMDDGAGFVMTDTRHGGYGFTNMHARAKRIGGTLRIQSKLGQGTQVIAEFPLEPILIPV
jgi:signal transduction histidine kinase